VSRVDDGNWHHVACVYDNGAIRIYIDGVLDASTTRGATYGNGVVRYGFLGTGSEAPTYNGSTGPNSWFNGDLDEFRIWSVARTQAQIQADMNNCLIGLETGLEVNYRMDESGSATSAPDANGTSRVANLFNFTLPGAWISSGLNTYACPTCTSTRDTALAIIDRPSLSLGPDTCGADSVVFDLGLGFSNIVWSNGDTTASTSIDSSALVYVEADSVGYTCTSYDTVRVLIAYKPDANDTIVCPGNVTLTVNSDSTNFYWYDGSNTLVASGNSYLKTDLFQTDSFFIAEVNLDTTRSALRFDGTNDYVALNMSYSPGAGIPTVTVEGWVRTTVTGVGTNDNWSIVDFDRSEYYNLFVRGDNGRVGFATATQTSDINDFYSPAGTSVNDGNWHHIAGVYDGTNKYIYVDGVLVATDVNSHSGANLGSVRTNTRFGFIGDGSEAGSFNAGRNDLYYAGDIDEVRIWSDVRTATEISSNRYLCLSGTEPNLEAYYKMDDGPGTSLTDYSGNGRTGTLFGMNSNTSWIGSGPVIDCYCGEGRRDTLIATVYPIYDSNTVVSSCPSTGGTGLLIQSYGGGGTYDYREIGGAFAYSEGFSDSLLKKFVANGGTYSVEVQDTNGCLDTIPSIVTNPTPGAGLPAATSTDSCRILSDAFRYYVATSSDEIIASIEPNGTDLGIVRATAFVEPSAQLYNNLAYLGRHYLLETDTQPSGTANIRLYFSNTEFTSLVDSATANGIADDDLSTIAELGMTKYNGPTANWVYDPSNATDLNYFTQVSSGTEFGASYVEFSIDSFSEFWMHRSDFASPLPIELLFFNATSFDREVQLRWSTSSERNNDYFSLERSSDDLNFSSIGELEGAGTKKTKTTYKFIDEEPLTGNSYYRLKQVDFDGSFDYSEIVSVRRTFDIRGENLQIYPNPNAGQFQVQLKSDGAVGSVVLRIYDLNGRLVFENFEDVLGESEYLRTIDLSSFPRGIYQINLLQGGQSFGGKLILR